MIVGIIDIGSNTARLLVATTRPSGELAHIRRERHYLRLGDDVHALGRIGKHKLGEAREVARTFSRLARKSGAHRIQTIITAPGRQSENSDELVRVLVEATGSPVEVISGDEEGRLAWLGAVARLEDPPETVAVIDLGGGSCEVAVGETRRLEPAWVRSVDAGALRVTRAFLSGNPPGDERVATARREIESLVVGLDAPTPDAVLAVGGTARAIGRVVGRRFDGDRLDELTRTLSTTRAGKLTRVHGVTPERAQTVLGGALVLAEIARRLDSQLEVGRGGLRDGAALVLTRAEAAA